MKYVLLSILFLVFFNQQSFAAVVYDFSRCNSTPFSQEKRDLRWSTPLATLTIVTSISTVTASITELLDRPKSTLKSVAGFTVLGVNIIPWIYATPPHNPSCKPVEQVPMTDEQRTELRSRDITMSYWVAGLQTVFSATLFFLTEQHNKKIITGVATGVPLLTSLLQWNRFKQGPYRSKDTALQWNSGPLFSKNAAGFFTQFSF